MKPFRQYMGHPFVTVYFENEVLQTLLKQCEAQKTALKASFTLAGHADSQWQKYSNDVAPCIYTVEVLSEKLLHSFRTPAS